MKKPIDISQWNRREHFAFYRGFDEPYHGVTVDLDCTGAFRRAKASGQSFFLTYLHAILTAANAIEALRMRIEGDGLVLYDTIHAGPTVGRPDHTFGFSRIVYLADFTEFASQATKEMDRVKAATGLCAQESAGYIDMIYMSVLPGIRFTALTNAQNFGASAGIPKITLGKCTQKGERMVMPVAVYVHHALVDGYHLEQFLISLESLLA